MLSAPCAWLRGRQATRSARAASARSKPCMCAAFSKSCSSPWGPSSSGMAPRVRGRAMEAGARAAPAGHGGPARARGGSGLRGHQHGHRGGRGVRADHTRTPRAQPTRGPHADPTRTPRGPHADPTRARHRAKIRAHEPFPVLCLRIPCISQEIPVHNGPRKSTLRAEKCARGHAATRGPRATRESAVAHGNWPDTARSERSDEAAPADGSRRDRQRARACVSTCACCPDCQHARHAQGEAHAHAGHEGRGAASKPSLTEAETRRHDLRHANARDPRRPHKRRTTAPAGKPNCAEGRCSMLSATAVLGGKTCVQTRPPEAANTSGAVQALPSPGTRRERQHARGQRS